MPGHAAKRGPSPSRSVTFVGPVDALGALGGLGALQRSGTNIIRSSCSCVLQFSEVLASRVSRVGIHAVGDDGLRGVGPPSVQPLSCRRPVLFRSRDGAQAPQAFDRPGARMSCLRDSY